MTRLGLGAWASWLEVHRQNQVFKESHVFLIIFKLMLLDFLISKGVLSNKVLVLIVFFTTANVNHKRICAIVEITAISLQGLGR